MLLSDAFELFRHVTRSESRPHASDACLDSFYHLQELMYRLFTEPSPTWMDDTGAVKRNTMAVNAHDIWSIQSSVTSSFLVQTSPEQAGTDTAAQ